MQGVAPAATHRSGSCSPIKVHTTIDVETGQIVGLEVTDESVKGDSPFNSLWNSQNPSVVQTIVSSGCLEMIVMTGTTFFHTIEQRKIASGIKTRGDASPRSRGSDYHADCVRMKRHSGGYRPLADEAGYGRECVFKVTRIRGVGAVELSRRL